jgi:predicted MFS family arabinose efflux permease
MKTGIACLIMAYVLSQFYRAFLAVMSPALSVDLGATPTDLASASGYWFLTFAIMQIPVGAALDKIGPRLTASVLLGLGGGGGAALFAVAGSPTEIKIAMALIGIGCSPVLMATYYIFARLYSPVVFGTLAGVVIGIGSLGNIGSSLPLTMAMEVFGWRGSLWALAAVSFAVAVAIGVFLRDPEKVAGGAKGSVLDLLRMPALWLIFPLMAFNYLPAAGLRGLWVGPYFTDVFAADAARIGQVTLAMGFAMVLGNFAYGPLDRVFGTRKWVIFGGNSLALLCLLGLLAWPAAGGMTTTLLICGVGLFGASFPMIMAHGRAFFPPHLVGRGVTLMNLFGIGATGVFQMITGRLHAATSGGAAEAPYVAIFGLYAAVLAIGLLIYVFSQDRRD